MSVVNDIKRCILNRCSYSYKDEEGSLVEPGDLLVKWGRNCNYEFRDKSFSVSMEHPNEIVIDWQCYDNINDNLYNMFTDLLKSMNISDKLKVTLKCSASNGESSYIKERLIVDHGVFYDDIICL